MSAWPIAASDLANALGRIRRPPIDCSLSRLRGRGPGVRARAELPRSPSPPPNSPPSRACVRWPAKATPPSASKSARPRGPRNCARLRTRHARRAKSALYAASFVGARFGGRLQVTGAVDPDDDRPGRLDGSYVAGKFGNWIVTLGQQDRWWGSGWEGSLIMSNNARPVPTFAIDRAVSEPFETKWLQLARPVAAHDFRRPDGRLA